MSATAQQLIIFALVCIGLFVWGFLAKEGKADDAREHHTTSPNGGIPAGTQPEVLQETARLNVKPLA